MFIACVLSCYTVAIMGITNNTPDILLTDLIADVRNCTVCAKHIPAPNPVIRAHSKASLLIIGQAPGTKVHASGIPWNDASGKRLRQWLSMSETDFYDETKVAIVPMGFCYPGKGKSGDLPPRPECAPLWHDNILKLLPNVRITLLIGQYAQNYYLPDSVPTLTERVRNWRKHSPRYFVMPHPSPRNQLWLRRNPWFEDDLVPELQHAISALYGYADET